MGSRYPQPKRLPGDLWEAVRHAQQSVIDAEVRTSRRAIFGRFRERLRTDPATLAADDFLALADPSTVRSAIVFAAQHLAHAAACDLQGYDAATATLRITEHRGFAAAFLEYFAAVDTGVPSACGVALATREPAFVDDVRTSPVFAGHHTRTVLLRAGSRAVQSYPLLAEDGAVLGMLSLHFRTPGRHDRHPVLARAAAHAIAQLGTH
ncbi:GAF domain-containing protein [Amycolatopsis solani]|uniref:GAF domain-containing protein n=1 Tax=Amycolatopsis solani TaxID=3028615 RepID=UPI0025B1338D|nr:GAF domain-containing protein [Amycolatopsis sp. MEP2-6]